MVLSAHLLIKMNLKHFQSVRCDTITFSTNNIHKSNFLTVGDYIYIYTYICIYLFNLFLFYALMNNTFLQSYFENVI